ncbi:MAG TPA: tetratricopeptide repeat protein [Bacteroidia bacterium]|jgi:tetratricopeptide (TPR) repeat protein|nr:tetratricopeptide repeat protein [Bacteroidia bacterium]
MSKLTSRQWLAVVGGFLLFAALFFINRKAPPTENPMGQQASAHAGNAVDFDQIIQASEDSIPANEKQLVDRLKNALSNSPDSAKQHIYAHLIQTLDSIGQPIISAYYTEKLAALQNSAGLWTHAGQQFYDYSSLGKAGLKDVLIEQAQKCFASSIKIDSNYADAQVGLGECMVDGSNPMLGIKTIESVLRKDSNNRNAQIALGKFSIRSNQLPKAIYRFKRVLQIDPSYKEAYLYLAQSYEESGNKQEAIANLKKYRIFAPDSAIKADIDKYIKEKLENDTIK